MRDVAKNSKNPTCSANFCFLSKKGGEGERHGWSWGCQSLDSGDRMGWDRGPSCRSWGSFASHPWRPPAPRSPQLQPLSLSPLLLYIRICRWNSNELSILWPPHFPTEGQCLPDAGSGRNSARRKGKSERMLFSSFLFLPAPPPDPPYFILRVCQAHSSLDVPLSLPSSPFILLALL